MSKRPLILTRRVLKVLVVLNMLYAAGIVVMFVASFAMPETLFTALGVRAAAGSDRLVAGMRLLMVVGLFGVPLRHFVLQLLLTITGTVETGDPFVVDNARRLNAIAWCVFGLEVLHLAVGAIAASSSSSVQPLDINWTFSIAPWLTVLLLFVLARVFDQGARMRADLEGTV